MTDVMHVRRTVVGLWLVFWGWILYPVAFYAQAGGMFVALEANKEAKLFLSPSIYVISFAMALAGVVLLARTRINRNSSRMMVAASFSVILRWSRVFIEWPRLAYRQIGHRTTLGYGAFVAITEFTAVVGLVALSIGTMWLCRDLRLPRSQRSWRITRNVLVISGFVPFVLCLIFVLMVISQNGRPTWDPEAFIVYAAFALCVSYIPLIFVAMATYGLGREAREVYREMNTGAKIEYLKEGKR